MKLRALVLVALIFMGLYGAQKLWAQSPNPNIHMKSSSLGLFSGFEKFVDELPIPTKIQVGLGKQNEVTVHLNQFKTKFHRDLPDTLIWGYDGSSPGPILEVEQGHPVRVHWQNDLPTTHLLKYIPTSMDGGAPPPEVRNVTHLHGAAVSQPSYKDRKFNSDGWPDAWTLPGEEQIADYPNAQSSRTLWYHDHPGGATARNVYAGLAGMYLIHDSYERSLKLPDGKFDIPILVQSRGFNNDGSLFYPTEGFKEFYGNALSVNGKVWPYLNVEPRKYRVRFLNASNARTIALKLIDLKDQSSGPAFYQIGSDAGFLENTVVLNDPTDAASARLELAPAERGDVIIDFSKYAGHDFILHNNSLTDAGEGEIPLPQVMLFKVASKVTETDLSQLPMKMKPIVRLNAKDAAQTRQIVFGQMKMADGTPMLTLNGKHWHDPIDEKPVFGTTEVWNLVNTLNDIHPFHIHLVEFQILDRTPFNVEEFNKTGKVIFTGASVAPDPNEMGWKDTVRVLPEAVTRIIMKFTPYTGFYVYHCHILEHEDMDMMRPFQVLSAPLK